MPDSIDKLIHAVEGVKSYRREWRRLGRKEVTEFYGLEEQLEAVDALGETNSKIALIYLKYVSSYKKERWDLTTEHEDGSHKGGALGYKINFENAKGPLYDALTFRSVEIKTGHVSEEINRTKPFEEKLNENLTYQRLQSAIKRLETSLKPPQVYMVKYR